MTPHDLSSPGRSISIVALTRSAQNSKILVNEKLEVEEADLFIKSELINATNAW